MRAHLDYLKQWWAAIRALPGLIHLLDNKIEDLRKPVKSYGDAIGGFSRDLQIIRDRITREWQADPKVQDILRIVEHLSTRINTLEHGLTTPPPSSDPALTRIVDCLERAFPPPPPLAAPSRPSDLSDLRTVTSEDADARSRQWRELARRHNIAPDSDLFQDLILAFEQEAAARNGETPPIDWEEAFREADAHLDDEEEIPEEAYADHGEPTTTAPGDH